MVFCSSSLVDDKGDDTLSRVMSCDRMHIGECMVSMILSMRMHAINQWGM